ncbi:hypothetical protein LIER_05367 [Lithospermum erythrorhizon]|uniref:Reverse transcriptase domain-containing protein n=1 Tax=Lithospermum erythrorhizon TaxID=34254 RepID=A0AAV3P320_LITER
MEIKLWKREWDSIKYKLKLPNAFLVDARGRKGGLALLWPRELKVTVLSFSSQHIEPVVEDDDNNPWRFVDPGEKVFHGINQSRLGLMDWKRSTLGNVHNSLKEKQEQLDTLQQRVITNESERVSIILPKEIDRLRETHDIYWQQRSRIEWRVKGDRNTCYFHAVAVQRNKKNLITAIRDGNRVGFLGMSFTKEKVPNPTKIPQFRQIALCNTTAKLIVKVLAERLKKVLASIVSECLYAKTTHHGHLSGIRLGHGCNPTSHLLFADDTLLFGEAREGEARSIISILQKYEVLSGQLVRLQKSAVLFSPNVRKETKEAISRILGMPEITSHGSYLGLPSTIGTSKREVFSFIVGRVKSGIEDWKPKILSKTGKVVFIT